MKGIDVVVRLSDIRYRGIELHIMNNILAFSDQMTYMFYGNENNIHENIGTLIGELPTK